MRKLSLFLVLTMLAVALSFSACKKEEVVVPLDDEAETVEEVTVTLEIVDEDEETGVAAQAIPIGFVIEEAE